MASLLPGRALGVLAFVGVLLATAVIPGADALEKWGPFRGRIIDGETGEPIAGAAVLVVWYEVVPNPAHPTQKFFDAREAATDEQGFFEVPRLSPPFFGFRTLPPTIKLFAPGYVPQRTSVTPTGGELFIDQTVVQMRRLKTRHELWEKSRARPGGVPDEKMPGLLRAVNAERKMLGLDPVGVPPGRQP